MNMNNYESFCKPSLVKALHSVGLDKAFYRAQGQYLYYRSGQSDQEQAVLDLLGGYGAVILGHNHPEMIKTMMDCFANNLAFHNQFSVRTGAGELASLLNPILQRETDCQEKFLCAIASTGAESVEVALKHAEMRRGKQIDELFESVEQSLESVAKRPNQEWLLDEKAKSLLAEILGDRSLGSSLADDLKLIKQWNQKILTLTPIFIALKHAFHGKLNTSIQLTYGDMYRKPLRRLGLKTRFVSPSELTLDYLQTLTDEAKAYFLKPKIRKNTVVIEAVSVPLISAIIVEPLQGEGGVYALKQEDVKVLHEARDHLRVPLIADEVQSGCGRCGSFLAGSQIGLKPDYIVLSKGLGAGVAKIGLVAIKESQYLEDFDLIQSSTFGEDEFSTRVACAFIKKLLANEQSVLKQVAAKGTQLKLALQKVQQKYPDIIREIRGRGFLQGIEFQDLSNSSSVMLRTVIYQGGLGYLIAGYLLNTHHIRVAPPASAGNVVRLEPSIQLEANHIQSLCMAIEDICLALRYQDMGYLFNYLLTEPCEHLKAPRDFSIWYKNLDINDCQGQADIKVAFINHLISSDGIKDVDPSFQTLSYQQCTELLDRFSFDRRAAPFPPVRMQSKKGKTVDFILYPLNATSEQIGQLIENNQMETIRKAVDERIEAAREDGCTVAGLGMFTSIVTNNCKSAITSGIKLTSGNSLTVAMATEAIKRSVIQANKKTHTAVVVGAAGNIGSVYSEIVSEYCQKLILIGSTRTGSVQRVMKTAFRVYEDALNQISQNAKQLEHLKGIARQLSPLAKKQGWLENDFVNKENRGQKIYDWFNENLPDQAPIKISDSLEDIKQADLLVCAANASQAFISDEYLKKDVLVCDIAVPHNISNELLAKRPDIIALRGGIVSTPNGESLDPRARAYLDAGQVYACMAETIVLGMEQYQDHYSYGNIDKSSVIRIFDMALENGLTLCANKTSESM